MRLRNSSLRVAALTAALAQVLGGALAASAAPTLKMDPTMLSWTNTFRYGASYHVTHLSFTDTKPIFVKHEPVYRAKPRYAIIHLGNGPHADHAVAVDEPAGAEPRVYVDTQGNGDLTKNQTGKWDKRQGSSGMDSYSGTYVFRVSYGTPKMETSSTTYGLNLYREPIRDASFFFRAGVRKGRILVAGKPHEVILSEDANDAMFVKPMDPYNPSYRGVWLRFEDGQEFDIRGTFVYQGVNYQALASADGATVTLKPTKLVIRTPVPNVSAQRERPLLPNGSEAPDFTAIAPDGSMVKLSDLRGKIVVIDFWATWCGPCQHSLPHLQKVTAETKDQNVYVLALNVWDDKPAYQAWIPAHPQYTFNIALDPAGRKTKESIATKLFKVSGIPTTYVIGPDGKIANSFVGYDDGDHRLEDTIKKLTTNKVSASNPQ